jgi:hypothetical protein
MAYLTKLELVNHILVSIKGVELLRDGDIDRTSPNELGAYIAVEYDKVLDKALWAKDWYFTTKVYDTKVVPDEILERCVTVLSVEGTDDSCHHIAKAWLTEEYKKEKSTRDGRMPNLLVIVKNNKDWRFGINLDIREVDNKDNIVKVNVVKVPDITQMPFAFAEHIEKELEISLYNKITGNIDTNRFKITKQQSIDALAEAMRADDLLNKANSVFPKKDFCS